MSMLGRRLAGQVQRGLATKSWTQKELAEKASMTQKHLSQILSGSATASIAMWDLLLHLVGTDRDETEADDLLRYALTLRMYGERGDDETWRKWDTAVEEYLRDSPERPGLPPRAQVPVAGVGPVVELRRRMEHYYRAAVTINGEVEDTLAPVLGYEAYKPGEPGYSEDKVNYITGDHVAQSLAMEAAAKIEKLQEVNEELSTGWLFWRGTYADFRTRMRELIGQLDAGVVTEREHCEKVSHLFQDTPEVTE